MNGPFQQKEVLRYGLLFAATITALLVIFHDVFKIPANSAYLFSLLVGTRFVIVIFINVFIAAFVHRNYPYPHSRRVKAFRWLAGYSLAISLYAITDRLEFRVLSSPGQWTIAGRWTNIVLESVLNNSIVLIMQNFVLLRVAKTNMEIENSRLRAANMESVNLLLKQQIHPHFLFNALSMMKSLYKTDIHAGEAYLVHLVNFLRASMISSSTGTWKLADEIKLCHDYIEMQHVRFQNALRCVIDIPATVVQAGFVPSFSLQTLIENAIKHNEVSTAAPLTIRVYYQEGCLVTQNNLQPRRQKDHASGKGLSNLIERYKILSGDAVNIRQDQHHFSVSIKVLNHENSHHRG
jgi:sensor histidine kinase YesM